jgi:phosphoribosylamine--glycine ligase
MNILLIDKGGYFLDFALRCRAAGHAVRWFLGKLKGGDRNPQGDGFGLDKRTEWETSMRWADLIVLPDNSVYMAELEVWRRRDFPIWGPNVETAGWELNRETGMAVLAEAGCELIDQHKFRRVAEAMEFLRANPRRFVSKVNDDNDSKALSYVAKSPKDMMFMLEKWDKQGAIKSDFIFQEFVPGIEVAVGGWFGKAGFSPWFLENFEHKKLMNGEVGVNTGEMGTVMKYTRESALARYFLEPLEGQLYRSGFTGYIDVAAMIAKDGTPYPLEFTTRPGWPLFEIQQALHPDPCQWMYDMLCGGSTFSPKADVALGVVMTMPDFPYCNSPQKDKEGYPLYGWEKVPEKNLHLTQVRMGEAPGDNLEKEPVPVTTGECVCTVSGTGKTVTKAKAAAYKNLDHLELPNSPMYRTDIGDRLKDQLPKLQRHGWMTDWEFGED